MKLIAKKIINLLSFKQFIHCYNLPTSFTDA